MAPPEHSDSMTRPEHSNADEAQKQILKSTFIKMIEALKKEIKIHLKKLRKNK